MRILCCTTPMEGVFAPVVPLASALVKQGHQIVVATAPDLVGRVQAAGLDATAAGPTARDAAARAVADPEFAAGAQPWRIGAVMFARIMAPEKLPTLRALADEFVPDLVLHAPVDLAAPLLAATRAIPSITYGTGLPLEPELLAAMAGWVAPLWRQSGLAPERSAGLYRNGYLDPVPRSLRPKPDPTLGTITPIRPSVPGAPDDPLPDPVTQLGSRPVVYLSLGTVPIFTRPELFTLIAEALADEDLDLVITVGPANDPATATPRTANAHWARWLPLAALLPRCAAVICHAGAGTTLAALAHGLPLVLLPQGADQYPTAACHAQGAALVLGPRRRTGETVRSAVRTVLDDPAYRAHAARLRTEIEAMPTPAQVAHVLPTHLSIPPPFDPALRT